MKIYIGKTSGTLYQADEIIKEIHQHTLVILNGKVQFIRELLRPQVFNDYYQRIKL